MASETALRVAFSWGLATGASLSLHPQAWNVNPDGFHVRSIVTNGSISLYGLVFR